VTETLTAVGDDVTVRATVNYVVDMPERGKFHAQDHGRDNLRFNPQVMPIANARGWREPPSLEREGVALVPHRSKVRDFHDRDEVVRVYLQEVEELVRRVTGASTVFVLPGGGMVRYAERSPLFGTGVNTQPARFPHVDFTPLSSPGLQPEIFGAPGATLRPGQRLTGYNIWRVISEPPQDVPLAVCDARTVAPDDLFAADGVYDDGDPSTWWELEAYVVKHNPAHRWLYFRDMAPDEALMFRSYGNEAVWRAGVPHTAFDDPTCPPDAAARMSIEARAYAVFD